MNKTKFKETEIGLIPEDWEVKKLGNCINFNPKRELKIGSYAKKIAMEKLQPFTKQIQGFEYTKFSGGTKFKNGDTIVARITPCLENGKTAFINILLNNEIAFGSTEFIVLSKKDNITINEFIYYLSTSPNFRNHAISSMTGSSGRQRIQNNFLMEKKIPLPPLPEQKAIAKILSDLDSKIELLQKQNETLEKIGQAIFKHWFVDFEFDDENGNPYKSSGGKMIESELGMIPEGWSVGKLGEYVNSVSGCSYTSKGLENSEKALVTLKSISINGFSQDGFKEYTGDYKECHIVKDGDIVVAHTDLTQNRIILGKPAIVRDLGKYKIMIASMDLSIVTPIKLLNRPYLFYLLNTKMFHSHAQGYSNGTTVIHLSRKAIPQFSYIIPGEKILKSFKIFSENTFKKIRNNQKEILALKKTRDLLLPKLMSGKIRVPFEELNENFEYEEKE